MSPSQLYASMPTARGAPANDPSPGAYGQPGCDRMLEMSACIGAGIGYAALLADGAPVYEYVPSEEREPMTVAEAEALACAAPTRAWEIRLVALLDERQYRRCGDGCWMLVRRGHGLS